MRTIWRASVAARFSRKVTSIGYTLVLLLVLACLGCGEEARTRSKPISRIVTFESSAPIYMGTGERLLFDGEKPLKGLTTSRIEIPSDPADVDFVDGSSVTPEHTVRCKVGTKLRTTVTWDGSRLRCETR